MGGLLVYIATALGVLALLLVLGGCFLAIRGEIFRGDDDLSEFLAWSWPLHFPLMQAAALVLALLGAWWSWWARAAALAALVALIVWGIFYGPPSPHPPAGPGSGGAGGGPAPDAVPGPDA
jgi:hypothetical protein